MFWRSVVGKLAITILLLVSFVLFILSILLLEFFEGFHVQEAEKGLRQTASKISLVVNELEDKEVVSEMAERIKDPTSKVMIYYPDETLWISKTSNSHLKDIDDYLPEFESELEEVLKNDLYNSKITIGNDKPEIMVSGTPLEGDKGAIFVFQSLDVLNQTKAETTKIIFVAAAIAIVLTTIFAFFLSTRITSPLMQMKEAAKNLARGEFNTKLPVVSNDEIGELAVTFNRMGRQLQYSINALRQEKEQMTSVVNSMADGVITLTRDAEIIVINPPAEQFIHDWCFENNVEFENYSDQLPDELKEVLKRIIKDEKEVLQELNLQGRNWVTIMTPLYDNSYVRGAVAVIRDMTEERQLDKLRKDFIANVSHELRTPIALMQGYSEAIVDDIAESNEEKNELAQIIHDESLRMSRLVNELLDIGRMEAGHIELNLDTFEIDPFLDRIQKKFTGLAEESGIEFTMVKDFSQSIVTVDADRIDQVFTNLIDNAFRHTKPGGYVKVFITLKDEQLRIKVEDNGVGIPEKDLSFIFERFYKADKSRTRSDNKKGTGLGLAITKYIVNAHNGTILVKSKEHEGTTFSIKIPQKTV